MSVLRECIVCGSNRALDSHKSLCIDCDTERSEDSFRDGLARFLRQMHRSDRRAADLEVRVRWWRRPVLYRDISNNPGLIVGSEPASPEITAAEEGNAIHVDAVADPPFEKDELPQISRLTRQDVLENAYLRLGIRSPFVRFVDPIPASTPTSESGRFDLLHCRTL